MPTVAAFLLQGQPLPRHASDQRQLLKQNSAKAAVQHLSTFELTKRIRHGSPAELLRLHNIHKQVLDDVHVSAFYNRLANCSGSSSSRARHPGNHLQHAGVQRSEEQQLLLALHDDLQQLIPSLRPRAAANIFWSMSKLQQVHLDQHLLQQLLHHMHRQLGFSSFEPRQLCIIAYALVQLQARGICMSSNSSKRQLQKLQQRQYMYGVGLLDDLYSTLGCCMHCCSAHDVAQAVYTLAQLGHVPPHGWLETWLHRAQQVLPQFAPQGLANAAYGLAVAIRLAGKTTSSRSRSSGGSSTTGSLTALMHQHHHQQQNSTAAHISVAAVQQYKSSSQQQQLLQLQARACTWLQSCMRVAVLHLPQLQPGELYGQLLWASCKLHCPLPQPACHHILARAEELLPRCDGQHLAIALYCFARLDLQPPPSWLHTFWRQVARQFSGLKPIDVSQLCWAAAELQLDVPLQMHSKFKRVLSNMLAAGPRSLHVGFMVSTVRSLTGLRVQLEDRQWVRFQGAMAAQVQMFGAQEYADVLWALAVGCNSVDQRWLERLLMASAPKLQLFSPEQLSSVLWAVVMLKHQPARNWMLKLFSASLSKLADFHPSHFSQTLWAMSQLEVTPSPLWLSSLWSNTGQTLTKFTAQELTKTAAAVVTMQLQPPAAWVQSLTEAVDQNIGQFDSNSLLQALRAVQKLQLKQAGSSSRLGLVGSSSSSSDGSVWRSSSKSSIVPFYSTLRQQQQQHHVPGTAVRSMRQYRAGSSRARQVSNGGRSSNSEVLPPAATGSCVPGSYVHHHRQQQHGAGEQSSVEAMFGFAGDSSSSSSSSPLQRQAQESAVAVLQHLDEVASEAYSMACLVVLMPDWLQHKVSHWPQQLAADRAGAQQQPQQQQLERSLAASVG